MFLDGLRPALLLQPLQVVPGAFAAGQNNKIGWRNGFIRPHEHQVNARVESQRIKIVVVADSGQYRHHHFQGAGLTGAGGTDAVFGVDHQPVQVWQNAEHRLVRVFRQPVQPGLQQPNITPEPVDDKTRRPVPLTLGKQRQCTHQLGENPTLVDIPYQQHRAIGGFGKTHVGNVVGPQVDFRGAAGAFGDDHIVAGAQIPPARHHRIHRLSFVGVVIQSIHIAMDLAPQDHLGAAIALGFQQHRVHVAVGLQATGQRL